MRYLIDGYNLIGKIDHILLSDANKEDKLLAFITRHVVDPKDRFVVVFDGQDPYVDIPHKSIKGAVTIYTTPFSESADAYMIRQIESQPKSSYVVVSSDNAILTVAKRMRCKWMKSEDFLKSHRYPQTELDDDKPSSIPGDLDYWLSQFS